MSAPNIISFQTRLDEFYFLGIENLVTENANFGAFWGNFLIREDMMSLPLIKQIQIVSIYGLIIYPEKKFTIKANL